VELTPRTRTVVDDPDQVPSDDDIDLAPAPRPRDPSRRRWLPLAVVGIALVAMGWLVVKGLTDATLYFLNADEAVAQKADLGDKRFRLQGEVVEGAVRTDDGVNFDVTYNGVTVPVHHSGDPQDMFEPGIPVVLEGHWDASGEFFDSDHMLIKHSSEYKARDDYDQRMSNADNGSDSNSEGGSSNP
jgi:cytochrome c-type biogenesis protein CcmE